MSSAHFSGPAVITLDWSLPGWNKEFCSYSCGPASARGQQEVGHDNSVGVVLEDAKPPSPLSQEADCEVAHHSHLGSC